MSAPLPKNHAQIMDLLPEYLNGQLDTASLRLVREHLLSCAACQNELASWQALKGASTQVFAETPLPSTQVMNQVWAKIDAPAEHVWRWSPGRALHRLWLVLRAQIPLIHKSIWVVSALVCLFGLTLTLLMAAYQTHVQKQSVADLLVLFIVVAGASGSAFLYGTNVDPGFELTLATPTSVRLLMLCRMILVLGYNFCLALLASAIFAIVYGGGLWGMMQLWLGPLLFLSSLCLAISLLLGSTIALICGAVLELLQAFPAKLAAHLVSLPLPTLDLAPTSPMLLITTLLLFAFALFYVPRQPRLVNFS